MVTSGFGLALKACCLYWKLFAITEVDLCVSFLSIGEASPGGGLAGLSGVNPLSALELLLSLRMYDHSTINS
jgi:hypothetical protein